MADIMDGIFISVVQTPGPWKAKARDEYGTVMGYCCSDGHRTMHLAQSHGKRMLEGEVISAEYETVPRRVKAVQWRQDNEAEMREFIAPSAVTWVNGVPILLDGQNETRVSHHDWVIKTRNGCYELVSSEDFHAQYRSVDD